MVIEYELTLEHRRENLLPSHRLQRTVRCAARSSAGTFAGLNDERRYAQV